MITPVSTPPSRKPKSISSFILKTYQLLNDQQNDSVIKWSPNGIGFVVINQLQFSRTILPKYFKHSNYSSFVRQLNMYNFHKIRQNNGESYFHHEHFDRDNTSALTAIKRKPEKKKRRLDQGDEFEDAEREFVINTNQAKENFTLGPSDKHKPLSNQPSSKLLTESNQLPSYSSKSILLPSNAKILTTKHLFSSQFTIKFQNLPFDTSSSSKKIDQHIFEAENQFQNQNQDKISINNDLDQRTPPFLTKDFIYPSKHNLFPFNNKAMSNFDIFF